MDATLDFGTEAVVAPNLAQIRAKAPKGGPLTRRRCRYFHATRPAIHQQGEAERDEPTEQVVAVVQRKVWTG